MNLPELLKIAEAATPGEWRFSRDSWNVTNSDGSLDVCVYIPESYSDLTGEYIAAFNPSVAIEIIKRLQEAEKDLKRYAWIQENWAYAHGVVFLDGEFDLGPFVTLDDVIDAAINGGKQ